MLILAFDTNFSGFSVALISDDKVIYQKIIEENGRQSELLIPEIENLLRLNNINYGDLNLIAASKGPGSFTGTRIGLTAAKTIKLATNLPLILVNSCEVISYKYRQKFENIFVLIDANAGDFFYSYNEEEPKLTNLEELLEILPKESFFLCGSGKNIASQILQEKQISYQYSQEKDEIEAGLIGLLAREKFKQETENINKFNPIYLREPKISIRKK